MKGSSRGQDLFPTENDLELLLELSEGSIGTAAAILQIDGLELYRNIERILALPGGGFSTEIDAFSDRLSKTERTRFTKCLLISQSAP